MAFVNKKALTEEESKAMFEQYKLYVEMADRISQRRMNANTFFISVNTLLCAVTSFLNDASATWKTGAGRVRV